MSKKFHKFISIILLLSVLLTTTVLIPGNVYAEEYLPPGPVMSTFHYILSSESYSVSPSNRPDLNAIIQSRYGKYAQLADWIEIKDHINDIQDFCDDIGLPIGYGEDTNGAFVSSSQDFGAGDEYYFIERHDGAVPDNWLSFSESGTHYRDTAFDQRGEHYLDLGSNALITLKAVVKITIYSKGPCDIIKVISPSDNDYVYDPFDTTINATIPIKQKYVTFDFEVSRYLINLSDPSTIGDSPGTTWKVYANTKFKNPITTIDLTRNEPVTVYIRVISVDGIYAKIYTMTITRK